MTSKSTPIELAKSVETLGLNTIQRHIFICADATKPECCDQATSIEVWNYLKRRLRELKLDQPTETSPSCIFRTKANCLRVCHSGPILLVYPDGVWYHSVDKDAIDRILTEHIMGNQPVQDYLFLTHPLPQPISQS